MNIDNYALEDPIAAVATALTPAALGIIRTSGKNCIELAAKIFSRKKALLNSGGNTILHGWIIDGGKKIDEVVLCIYKGPKSFTGEDSVEIICHGGTAVVIAIYRLLIKAGFRKAEAGEFSFRAFINGKTDLTGIEAVSEIIAAKTQTSSEFAAGRLAGNLHAAILEIKNGLLKAVAAADVEIEYPEDETSGSFSGTLISPLIEKLKMLADAWLSEKVFRQGAKVVLAGKTNAGKSSLFNTLIKEDRAIVSDIHGTTRDWLEAGLSFNGIPVSLYDTAGFRMTEDTIEAAGVKRSMQISSEADLIFYLIDSLCYADKDDAAFLQKNCLPCVIVRTKTDLAGTKDLPEFTAKLNELIPSETLKYKIVSVSAKTGSGINELISTGFNLLTGGNTEHSQKNVSLGTERQKECVEKTLDVLTHALNAWETGFPLDAVVHDLEEGLQYLGEITGEVKSESILSAVFSGFCVGK